MAVTVTTWVWNHSRSRHGARLVLLAIADTINEERIKAGAWPSVAALAAKTALKERAVRAAITELAELGELAVQYNAGPKGCNLYHLPRAPQTPAKNAGVQSLQGAESAPPQNLQGSESEQVDGQDPANFAPPADPAPLQKTTAPPAESAPGTIREPEVKDTSPPRRDLNAGREDVRELCTHLADRIERNGSKRPNITKGWLDAARLLLDNDGRSAAQVHKAIDWCQDNEFWRRNILSMPKLREKYDRLRMQAEDERRNSANGHPSPSTPFDRRVESDRAHFARAMERAAARERGAQEELI